MVFLMKLIKWVVSMICDSCFWAIDCKRENKTKLEMRPVGPMLPEVIGRPIGVFLYILVNAKSSGIHGGFWPEESHF